MSGAHVLWRDDGDAQPLQPPSRHGHHAYAFLWPCSRSHSPPRSMSDVAYDVESDIIVCVGYRHISSPLEQLYPLRNEHFRAHITPYTTSP